MPYRNKSTKDFASVHYNLIGFLAKGETILGRSQYCTLSMCKFKEQNTLYFDLSNDNISLKDKNEFSLY
jgi:hypothetical protein